MEKIFDNDPECFLRLKKRRFYVFEKHIIFRSKDGIFAVPFFKKERGFNSVDLFEEEYSHLGLKYEFMGDLGREDIQKINQRLEKLDV